MSISSAGVSRGRTSDRPPAGWSLDAWAAVRPARAFAYLAVRPSSTGSWLTLRRPLLIAVVLGCVGSLLAAGTLTARIAISTAVFWAYVPLVEALAVVAVTWWMRDRPAMATVIDSFFVGHAPSTLFLLGLAATLTSLPFDLWWAVLTGPALWVFAAVALWSAWVDFCFFRHALRMPTPRAAAVLFVQRLITWTVVFVVFAIVGPSARVIFSELSAAFIEVSR
jgi:hypothetical protein